MKAVLQTVPERMEKAVSRCKEAGITFDVNLDSEKKGPFYNFAKGLLEFPSGNEYRLSMQDDMIYSDGFVDYLPHLESEMRSNGMHLLSLWAPRMKQVAHAHSKNRRYMQSYACFSLQCTIFSPTLVEMLIDYAPHYKRDWHDDYFVEETCRLNGVKTYVHLPSIVQHDLGMKSSLNHNANTRSGPRTSPAYDPDFISRWKLSLPKQSKCEDKGV